jgi:hypothetical protein
MGLQTIDYRGLVDLDRHIVDQLETYLKEKESRLCQQIINVLPFIIDPSVPTLSEGNPVKLSEAVEMFTRKVRLIIQKKPKIESKDFSEKVSRDLNAYFWDYTEALEGCVTELFQRVKQVNIDKWHLSLSEVVHQLQDLLMHRIDDLMWAIRRMESPLKDLCQAYPSANLPFWRKWLQSCFDPNLLKNLEQSKKQLSIQYEDFNERFKEFRRLSIEVENSLDKMKRYPVLALMDMTDQNLYVDVFRILKMIEINPNSKGMLAEESIRTLKYLASLDSILKVFKHYYKELKDSLFKSSLEFKSLFREKSSPYFEEGLNKLKEKVLDYQNEVQQLINTISQYRTFVLKNDSNPYVSARLGFTERIVGPEPASTAKLINLAYMAEELNGHYKHFLEALHRDDAIQLQKEEKAQEEIDKLLHEIGQPLISHSMMRNRAELLLKQIKMCDELGTPDETMIDYIQEVLSKSMREDWKYHVLHEFPLFHEIYRLHQGINRRFDDPAHAFRNERFHLFFDQIEGWVQKGDLFTHIHEIELDINDMKTYLQDFLAAVQRSVKDKSKDPFLDETFQKYQQQLLEYRYIFGQFFSTLMVNSKDGQQLRMQFLFVDQYFETIENLLTEMKTAWESHSLEGESE